MHKTTCMVIACSSCTVNHYVSQEITRPHPASPSVDPLKSGRSKYGAAWQLPEGIERDTSTSSPATSARAWRPPMRGKRSSQKTTAPPHPGNVPASGAQAERTETDMSATLPWMEAADAAVAAIHAAKQRAGACVTGSLAPHLQIPTPARFYLSPLCAANLLLTPNQTMMFNVSLNQELLEIYEDVKLQITPPPNVGLCFDVSCAALAGLPAGLTQNGWAFLQNRLLVLVMDTTSQESVPSELKPVSAE